jgi:phage/plasmid-associated DNA primase
LYATLLKPFISSEFGLDVAENPKVIRLISTWLTNHDLKILDCTLEENLRYSPFINGFFDLETKELIPEKIDAYNQHRITFDYVDVADDDETIQRFKKYWGHWLKDNELGDLLLNWIILNAQRQAYRTGMMVGLVGDSGIGKSAFGSLIQGLFHRSEFAQRMSGDFLTSTSNSHASAELEGCYSVILEELKGETDFTSAEKIKDFTGDKKAAYIKVNPKGEKPRNILLRLGITFNCEGTLVLKAKEAGFYRRSVIIPVYAAKSKSEANGVESDYLREPENLKKILCWCQKQDTEAALKCFAEIAKSSTVTEFKRAMRFENNLIAQFLDEMVTITNDKAKYIKAQYLYTAYIDWCDQNKHRHMSQQSFGREVRRVARSSDISEDFNWLEEFAEMTGQQRLKDGTKAVAYFGMKFKADDTKDGTDDPLKKF